MITRCYIKPLCVMQSAAALLLLTILVSSLSAADPTGTAEDVSATDPDKVAERIRGGMGAIDYSPSKRAELSESIKKHPTIVVEVIKEIIKGDVDSQGILIPRALGLTQVLDTESAAPLANDAAKHLQSELVMTRRAAVEATAHCAGHSYVSSIVLMLDDPDRIVRYRAVEALGKIGRKEDLPALELWLQRAKKADAEREPGRRWLQGAILEAIERARVQMADGDRRNSRLDARCDLRRAFDQSGNSSFWFHHYPVTAGR